MSNENPISDNPDDDWTGVIRYVLDQTRYDDRAIHRQQPIMCPLCAPTEEAHDDVDGDEWLESQLVTNGSVTVCADSDCEYIEEDNRQIRATVTDSRPRTVGPKRDDDRCRYTNSGGVALCGGSGWL